MSHIFLDTRGGRLALYINGELQFDREDERLYHEPLAQVPAALSAQRFPERGLRVLILGGGDGLALREVLRQPRLSEARLVERDPEMLSLGRGRLAALNMAAFSDARATVVLGDARDELPRCRDFDLLIYDLTYPGDVEGAQLFRCARFAQARRALKAGGILAVNAVSPERTPRAFACIGASLEAAGLRARPYAFALPSFQREGYGRWGFFLASTRAVTDAELASLRLPAGCLATPASFVAGTRLPRCLRDLRVCPNRTDELIYYLNNDSPLDWAGEFADVRFESQAGPGPRLTAAEGFAAWLKERRGRRSLEGLLRCVPLSRRQQTREAILDWSQQAEVLFRELDLLAFAEETLRHAQSLPKAWQRELRRLRDGLSERIPPMRELLESAWRVFAVFLLILLLSNLFFPDNIYAKGFSSHYGGSGDSMAFSYTSSNWQRPYSYRCYLFRSDQNYRDRVYDSNGNPYQSQRFALSDKAAGRRTTAGLLALSPDMQLLDSGAVSYRTGQSSAAGFRAILEPSRLRVFNAAGAQFLELLPSPVLLADARQKVLAQDELIAKAIEDHGRWLEWTRWSAALDMGAADMSVMQSLKDMRQAAQSARQIWTEPPGARSAVLLPADCKELYPGVYLEPAGPGRHPEPELILVSPDATLRRRSIHPPDQINDEDRFIFSLLQERMLKGPDESLRPILAGWVKGHAAALGVLPATSAAPPPPAVAPKTLPPVQ